MGSTTYTAYLVWAALIYAGVGTWLTVKIGRPLVSLNFFRQRFEADFGLSLVRLRENAESVAPTVANRLACGLPRALQEHIR